MANLFHIYLLEVRTVLQREKNCVLVRRSLDRRPRTRDARAQGGSATHGLSVAPQQTDVNER